MVIATDLVEIAGVTPILNMNVAWLEWAEQ